MSKKRLGRDPFSFIKDSREKDNLKPGEKGSSDPEKSELTETDGDVIQINKKNKSHEITGKKKTFQEQTKNETIDSFEEEKAHYKMLLKHRDEENARLRKSDEQKQQDINKLLLENEDLKTRYHARGSKLNKLNEEHQKVLTALEEKNSRLEEISKEKLNTTERLKDKASEFAALKRAIQDSENRLRTIALENKKIKYKLLEKRKAWLNEKAFLKKEREHIRRQFKSENAQLISQSESMIIELNRMKEAYNSLEKSNDFLNAQLTMKDQALEELNEIKDEITNLLFENKKLNAQLQYRENENERLLQDFTDASTYKKEAEELKEKLSLIEEEKEKLNERLLQDFTDASTYKKEAEELKEKLSLIDEEKEKLKRSLDYEQSAREEDQKKSRQELERITLELDNKKSQLHARLQALENKNKIKQEQNESLTSLLEFRDSELQKTKDSLNRKMLEIDKLIKWIDDLDLGINTILESNRWKLADYIGTAQRKALFRAPVPMPSDFVKDTLNQYHKWKEKDY